ncbi:MBL fold metallo-hydrolase, partial [bacterium LRH843]|nr:MBL fold metallo-hydrolase [bacterium LRH843]
YVGFDVNPEQAVETRRRVMERMASDGTKVAGMHHLFPGFGNVGKGAKGAAYRFVEAPFEYEL